MENWTNLNRILELSVKDLKQKESNAQKMIELTQAANKKEIIKLLKEGSILNFYADKTTPLIETIRIDNEELCDFFLKAGSTINFKPSNDINDAFWESLQSKKHSFLRRFILKKCLITRSKDDEIALIWATKESDVEAVELLLSHGSVKINERDMNGNTALHHNVMKSPHTEDDITIGKMLIAAGADIMGTNFDNKTPEELAEDYAAKTALLHSKIEQKLPEKEDNYVPEEPSVETPGVSKTKGNKIKI